MASNPRTRPMNFMAPPAFPPGVDPATFHLEAVTVQIERAAFFSLSSVNDLQVPNISLAMPGNPQRSMGMEVHQNIHRLDIKVQQPNRLRLEAEDILGHRTGTVHFRWLPIPHDFQAAPDRVPPATELNASHSQRFVMMNVEFRFADPEQSGFYGFGVGRTFPVTVDNQPQLRIGSVVEILEGFGRLDGYRGNVIVAASMTPGQDPAFSFLVRVVDPEEELLARGQLDDEQPIPPGAHDETLLVLLGERDPDNPIALNKASDARIVGAAVHERLRLVHIGMGVDTGLCSRMTRGPIVGSASFALDFNPHDTRVPFPFQTHKGIFNFFGPLGNEIGTIEADIVEGRAFRTELAGAPMPILRMLGFGPLQRGSGEFANADGMLLLNGVLSIFPTTPSLLYMLRVQDPAGKLRAHFSNRG